MAIQPEDNQKEKEKELDNLILQIEKDALPQSYIQIFCGACLIGMFVVDKFLGKVIPPLPEYWYALLFGGVLSNKVIELLKFIKYTKGL